MKLTVDELLQLVYLRLLAEPESFGRKAATRRLAQLRTNIGAWTQLKVDIPKPAMSEEARELLKNSPKARPVPRKPEKPSGTAVATKKRKPRRKKREPVLVPDPTTLDTTSVVSVRDTLD